MAGAMLRLFCVTVLRSNGCYVCDSAEQVRASHLLIKHSHSRRPASRLSDNITRSKEEAIQKLLELRAQIVSGQAKFEDLAKQYSDCSSGTRGGDLGPFGRGMMQKPFEDATFALKVGELSNVVDTDSGVHIIVRTAFTQYNIVDHICAGNLFKETGLV